MLERAQSDAVQTGSNLDCPWQNIHNLMDKLKTSRNAMNKQ